MIYCPDCELKQQMSRITRESLMDDVSKKGIEVGEQVFNQRLAVCEDCFNLEAGIMCNMNGAYCIYLASKQSGSCPRNKWSV